MRLAMDWPATSSVRADPDAVVRAAVVLVDDHVLGNVHQAAGQVTGVGRAQRGIGQTLARAVRRDEVFQRRQAFAEVRADGQRDDAPGRVGHQAAHTGQLRDGARNRPWSRRRSPWSLRLPSGSMCLRTASATWSVVSCQISIMRSFCSCSVSRPRRNWRSTTSTSLQGLGDDLVLRSGGTVMSDTASVVPERVAYLKPMFLIWSATSSVVDSWPHSS